MKQENSGKSEGNDLEYKVDDIPPLGMRGLKLMLIGASMFTIAMASDWCFKNLENDVYGYVVQAASAPLMFLGIRETYLGCREYINYKKQKDHK